MTLLTEIPRHPETGAPAFDPVAVADAFLQGHRAAPIDEGGCREGSA